MDKRYQVFVSSTYADLREERQKVIQALMEMDCIPAGMELFPAADEEQWSFIKRIIDDCDYYILIIGGRYGSLTPLGISYTENEFDYAISIGLQVLIFVHEIPDEIPVGKSDIEPGLRAKLAAFRTKVSTNRLVKFWKTAAELPGLVALSLSKTIKIHPAIGWTRASNVAQGDVLLDLNTMRKENQQLRDKLAEFIAQIPKKKELELASINESVELELEHKWLGPNRHYRTEAKKISKTWRELFASIAPELVQHPSEGTVSSRFAKVLMPDASGSIHLQRDDLMTIRTQFVALRLIDAQYAKATNGSMGIFWSLTDDGHRLMMELRTVKPSAKSKD